MASMHEELSDPRLDAWPRLELSDTRLDDTEASGEGRAAPRGVAAPHVRTVPARRSHVSSHAQGVSISAWRINRSIKVLPFWVEEGKQSPKRGWAGRRSGSALIAMAQQGLGSDTANPFRYHQRGMHIAKTRSRAAN